MIGKKHLQLILMFSLIIPILLTVPVRAANSQGLYWGVEVGDEFNYTWYNGTTSYSVYARIDTLPTITNTVNESWTDAAILVGDITWFFENGTEIQHSMMFYAVALGNWDLLTQLRTESSSVVMISDSQTWGYRDSFVAFVGSEIVTLKCSKTDGVMTNYQLIVNSEFRYELVREGSTRVPQSNNLLVIIIGAVAIVAVVVVVIWWTRFKK